MSPGVGSLIGSDLDPGPLIGWETDQGSGCDTVTRAETRNITVNWDTRGKRVTLTGNIDWSLNSKQETFHLSLRNTHTVEIKHLQIIERISSLKIIDWKHTNRIIYFVAYLLGIRLTGWHQDISWPKGLMFQGRFRFDICCKIWQISPESHEVMLRRLCLQLILKRVLRTQ